MNIQLKVVNLSNDDSNTAIVVFQKNQAIDYKEMRRTVAWKVIKNLARNDCHTFIFPMELYVSAVDSYGNITQQIKADEGKLFHMILSDSGNVISYKGPAPNVREIQVQNDLQQGAISANIIRDGKLLATKTEIAPEQKAVFKFNPTIFIGVASQIVEGQIMDSAIISSFNTELPLMGLAGADIVMTGGGAGRKSTPYRFKMVNKFYKWLVPRAT